jgi:phospholipid-binding lipoprotein MlaA
MVWSFLSAVLLAQGAALPATDAAQQAVAPRDERVVVLPGEPPLGEMPATAEASAQTGDRPEIGPDGEPVIVVSGQESVPGDPMAEINAETFEVMQDVDQALVEPIANAYRDELPKPIRKGLGNFFANLREPLYALNFLLQLKPGKAAETLGRFAINSTVGIGGLVDVAKDKPFNLPRRRNGFANTLGYYGVGPGPFLYLPLVGSTTVRDLLGSLADNSFLPTLAGAPFDRLEYGVPAFVVTSLDSRIEFDDELQRIRESDEPYASMRETYLERRRQEIEALHGQRERMDSPTEGAQTVP